MNCSPKEIYWIMVFWFTFFKEYAQIPCSPRIGRALLSTFLAVRISRAIAAPSEKTFKTAALVSGRRRTDLVLLRVLWLREGGFCFSSGACMLLMSEWGGGFGSGGQVGC